MGFMDELLKGAPAQAAARGEDPGKQPIPTSVEVEHVEPKGAEGEVKVVDAGAPATAAEPEPDEDGETPSPDERGHVPFKAYQAERRKRQDYKTQAAVQTEAVKRLEAQLAAANAGKAPPAQTRQAAAPAVPNPVEDPEGFVAHTGAMLERQRLFQSEALVREHYGDEKVNAAFEVFKEAVTLNPKLYAETMAKQSPWSHVVKMADSLKESNALQKEGPDAYRARIVAEERAKWEQERSEGAPVTQGTATPAATKLPPSLAGARSGGNSRGAPTFSGPTPLGSFIGRSAASVKRAAG